MLKGRKLFFAGAIAYLFSVFFTLQADPSVCLTSVEDCDIYEQQMRSAAIAAAVGTVSMLYAILQVVETNFSALGLFLREKEE